MYTVLMVCTGEQERSLAWLLNIKSENHLSKLCFWEVRTPKFPRKVEMLCIRALTAAKAALSVFLGPGLLPGTCTSPRAWGSGSPDAEWNRDAEAYHCFRNRVSFIQKKFGLFIWSPDARNANQGAISRDHWGSELINVDVPILSQGYTFLLKCTD